MSESFEQLFFNQLKDIVDSINLDEINETVKQIKEIKEKNGRIFLQVQEEEQGIHLMQLVTLESY